MKQILCSYLGSDPIRLFFLSLALIYIISYYYLSGINSTSTLEEVAAFMSTNVEKDSAQPSYYGSIFSNLSRGLPIDESDSSSEPPIGQEEENSSSTVQGQQ